MNFLKVEQFYSDIYSSTSIGSDDFDGGIQSPPHELLQQVHNFLIPLNPPPDTLMKLRATAFKVASQYLQQQHDNDTNIRLLLRQIHGIVKAIHSTCYNISNNSNSTSDESFGNEEEIRNFLNQLLDEMKLDAEENERLLSFLRSQPSSTASAERLLSFVFTIGGEHFQDMNDSSHNEQVFRCMNVMVHAIETVFYQPKPYRLQLSSSTTATSSSSSSYSAMAATASGVGNGGNATTPSASIEYNHNDNNTNTTSP